MANKLYEETNILAIADAIRTKNGSTDTYKVADMPQAILDIPTGSNSGPISRKNPHVDENGIWHKPDEWPDIESIEIPEGESKIYLLYANHIGDYNYVYLRATGSAISYSRGNIVDGEYVAETTPTTAANAVWISFELNDLESDYSVIEVTGTKIELCCTYNITNYDYTYQPCLMRYGRMPYGTSINFCCYYIESDNIMDFAKEKTNTSISLASAYYRNYNMARWRSTGWNIAGNYLTSLSSTFLYCYSLIDFTNDFTNWVTLKTTSLNSTFLNCYSIKDPIDVSTWDTSKVTNTTNMFSGTRGLRNIIGINSWDLSACTQMSYMLSATPLLNIDIDLSNWKLGSISKVVNISSLFSGSGVNSIVMGNCTFDGTNITNIFYAMPYCTSVDIKDCTFTNITSYAGFFYNSSLLEINIYNCDFSGVNVASAFQYLASYSLTLRKFTATNCTTATGKSIADTNSAYGNIFTNSNNLRYIDASFIDMSIFTGAYAHSLMFRALYLLKDLIPPLNICKAFYIGDSKQLSKESVLRIFNNLSTVTTSTAISIAKGVNSRLTTEDLAIATDKGWTVTLV